MKILLLEDDYSLNKIIGSFLIQKGFVVDCFSDGNEAIEQLLKAQYDLCIFDIDVPFIDGQGVLEFIRKEKIDTPVIMMSAMTDMDTIKRSYLYGCNDYLKKPFDIEELFLRVEYVLKHLFPKEDTLVQLQYGYVFDTKNMSLSKNSKEIELSKKEQLMLNIFVQHLGNTVTIQMLREYVWNGEFVESVSMRTIVHKLKHKLKSAMIINLRGVGYKLLN